MNRILRGFRNFVTGRFFLSVICLSVSAFLAFIALPQLYKSQEATQLIARVKLPISAGEQVEARHLEVVEIGSFNLPASALVYEEDVIGKFARLPMLPGDYIFQEKISPTRVDPALDKIISSGLVLVSITPKNSAQTVSSHLKSGDTVSLATITEERTTGGEIKRTVNYPENLNSLVVFDVESARGYSLDRAEMQYGVADTSLSSAQVSSEDLIPRTITFMATEDQARALLEAEYGQGLHVIFKDRRP